MSRLIEHLNPLDFRLVSLSLTFGKMRFNKVMNMLMVKLRRFCGWRDKEIIVTAYFQKSSRF